MDFLTSSIDSAQTGSMIGVLSTHFDMSDYRCRAGVKLYTLEDFEREYPSMKPMGFRFDEQGVLMSDSSVARAITDSVFTYMQNECKMLGYRDLDITDFVLQGVADGGYVIANYDEVQGQGDLTELGIFVPFKNFRVSNSSFNIYAPYQRKDGGFRTFSLLDLEYGSAKRFYAAFPVNVDLNSYKGLNIVGTATFNSGEYILYSVDLALKPFYASVGEAFLNYLAYSVSFYNIGEKVMRQMLPPDAPADKVSTERLDKVPRRPKVNVSIEHECKESRLQELMQCMSDPVRLQKYIVEDNEAAITYQWVVKAYTSPWYSEGEDLTDMERITNSCFNLVGECRKNRLKVALELLTHRYHIYSIGMLNDETGLILKGGGVRGKAIKRVGF